MEKIDRARIMLDELVVARKTTILKLQQLTGLLNFISKAIIPGRTFTRRMYAKFANINLKPHYHVNIDAELRADCMVWKEFLETDKSVVCQPFIDFSSKLRADKISFFTDAVGSAKLGYGCVFGNSWTFGAWGESFVKNLLPSIECLELFAVTVAIVLWAKKLENRRVIINCDNQAVVSMINKTVSSCPYCMRLVRIIVLTSLKHNVRFFADYLETSKNVLADSLSRFDFVTFRTFAPASMDKFPVPLPHKLLPPEQFFF